MSKHDEEVEPMAPRTHFGQAMDSSFLKLVQSILLALSCYFGVQTMTRLDRLEQSNNAAQVILAQSQDAVHDLKADKLARDMELQSVHNQLSDMVSRLAVLEARDSRK